MKFYTRRKDDFGETYQLLKPSKITIWYKPLGFPDGASGKEPACQCRRCGLNSWVRKILWRRKWQPTAAFLPGKPHGQRRLIGFSPWGRKESDMTERLHFSLRLVITFLPRSKSLLISWLQSPSAVLFSSVQFSHSDVSDSLRPMNRSTPGQIGRASCRERV